MAVRDDMATWLATLDEEDLAGVLARRPDAAAKPAPRNLDELAERLTRRTNVAEVFVGLPLPAIEVIEALEALMPEEPPPSRRNIPIEHTEGVDRAELAALFGRKIDDPELDATLRVLAQRALVWPDATGRLRMTEPLRYAFAHPLGLGRPFGELISPHGSGALQRIADRLGRPRQTSKAAYIADLSRWYATPGNVTRLVERAPDETRELLDEAAGPSGPAIEILHTTTRRPAEVAWATERGLLVEESWDDAEMPREVGLALRGPGWRAPFTPTPPAPALGPVAPIAVNGEAGSAAATLLDQLGALVDSCAANPVALRKSGGVGAREVRRLAKELRIEEPTVRLLLELARAAELISQSNSGVLPTAEYDHWAAQEPPGQLAAVLAAWWTMPATPLLAGTDITLGADPAGPLATELRPTFLRVIAELPPGLGVTDPASVGPLVRWSAPLPLLPFDDPAPLLDALWDEFAAVGACAHGAISSLGRALVDAQPVAVVAERLLASATATARFQADLTVVVPGTPAAPLRELLDGCADREARGAASIWRFSPASVRRALDAGMSTVDLFARLRGVAVGGTLPQPLEYLVADVQRRHGAVRVRTVGCVVRSDDTALLAEIAAARTLGPLKLSLLAATVLAAATSPEDTLAALRTAGYAPVAEDASGAIVIARPPRRRVEAPVAERGVLRVKPSPSTVDADGLARKLLAQPRRVDIAPPVQLAITLPEQRSSLDAAHLTVRERRLLANAIRDGEPVKIVYTDLNGSTTTRVIEQAELHGKVIEAWCRLRSDDRAFSIERIGAVFPA